MRQMPWAAPLRTALVEAILLYHLRDPTWARNPCLRSLRPRASTTPQIANRVAQWWAHLGHVFGPLVQVA